MQEENILVSIIIPAWNVEKYISKAIESCIGQTYTNIEILIIDDESTDATCEVVERYRLKDTRIRLEKKIHAGVSDARNKGIEIATGQAAVFLDSDDWLNYDAIEILLESFRLYPDYLIGARSTFVNEENQCTDITNSICKENITTILTRHNALMNTNTECYKNASASYKLFSLEIIRSNHLQFDNEVLFGEDGLFVFCYLNHVKGMIYHDISIWNVLLRTTSSTRLNYNEKFMTSIYGVEKMLKYPHEESEEIDTMLEAFLVTKALNMIRRYLDSGNTDSSIPRQYIKYVMKYKASYLKTVTLGDKIRTVMMIYMPLSLYMIIYRKTHCTQ